jgi:pimeloyl-ACP methyl ester carboxylesterase
MEYPGYGIYRNEAPSSETIEHNAQLVYDFVIQNLKFDSRDVILFGRSMGSGPACYLSSLLKPPSALLLLSPYTSLRDAVRTLLGSLPSMLVRDRFKNHEVIQNVKCPTLIIHGLNDNLIPHTHAQRLHA